jgi:hypothetical protein
MKDLLTRLFSSYTCHLMGTGPDAIRRILKSRGIAPAVLLFSIAFSWWMCSKVGEVTTSNEGLRISARWLDFGEVFENPAFEWQIPIENPTKNDIGILGFQTSCGCISFEPTSVVIPSGQTETFRLKLNLLLTSRKLADLDSSDVEIAFAPQVREASLQQVGWILRGRVRRLLRLSPRQLHMTEGLLVGQPFDEQTVVANSTIALDSISASCDPATGWAQVIKCLDKQNTFVIKVRPKQDLQPGPFRFNVTLQPTRDTQKLPKTTLKVDGKILSDINATPEFLFFGAQPIGKTVTETVILQAEGNKTFIIKGIESKSDGLTIQRASEGEGFKAFHVSQTISKLGKKEGEITFLLRKEDKTASTVVVRSVYIGIPSNEGPKNSGGS